MGLVDAYRDELELQFVRPIAILVGFGGRSFLAWPSAPAPVLGCKNPEEEARGSVAGRSVLSALDILHGLFIEETLPLLGLDCAACFVTLDTQMASEAMELVGLLLLRARLLQRVRVHQRRGVQFAGCANDTPRKISACLPQGDAMCPFALRMTLASPVREVMSSVGEQGFRVSPYIFG